MVSLQNRDFSGFFHGSLAVAGSWNIAGKSKVQVCFKKRGGKFS